MRNRAAEILAVSILDIDPTNQGVDAIASASQFNYEKQDQTLIAAVLQLEDATSHYLHFFVADKSNSDKRLEYRFGY